MAASRWYAFESMDATLVFLPSTVSFSFSFDDDVVLADNTLALAAPCIFAFLRSRSFCFAFPPLFFSGFSLDEMPPPPPLVGSCAGGVFSSTAPPFSNRSNSVSHQVMNFLTPSLLTSLFRTVSTDVHSLPMISCLTKSMDIFFGTPPFFIWRLAINVIRVVFPHPFRPIKPYRLPFASINEAFCNKSGPPPLKLGKSKFRKCTSAALSFAASSPPSPPPSPPPPSSSSIVMASSIARCRSFRSISSLNSFCRIFLLVRSDMASFAEISIILA
mmetsp:Transcript_10934/g.13546  ORF Transcript_10934/g.13546 Transcript_10934/m.13546 type:complete len:273 (+) Transcript_10934:1352-2170(+)